MTKTETIIINRVTKPGLAYIDPDSNQETRIYVLGRKQWLRNPLLAENKRYKAYIHSGRLYSMKFDWNTSIIKGPCQVYYSTPDKTGKDRDTNRTVPSLCLYDPGDPILWRAAGELLKKHRTVIVFSVTTWEDTPKVLLPIDYDEKIIHQPVPAKQLLEACLTCYGYSLTDAIDLVAHYCPGDQAITTLQEEGKTIARIAEIIVNNEYTGDMERRLRE